MRDMKMAHFERVKIKIIFKQILRMIHFRVTA
jgi:hypothetical protein